MGYPIILNLAQKRCVVVGAGRVAERRVHGLLKEDAIVRLVAPEATQILRSLSKNGKLIWAQEFYSAAHLDGAFLVIAATDHPDINASVSQDAFERGLLICRADSPDDGNFMTPATIQRGDLLITVNTSGNSPTLTKLLKERLAEQYGAEWEHWTNLFGKLRTQIQAFSGEEQRVVALQNILQDSTVSGLIKQGEVVHAHKEALKCLL